MEFSIKENAGRMIVTRCELDFTTPNGKHMYRIFGDGVRPDDYLVWSVGVRHKKYQEEIEKFLKENDCVDTTFKCHRFYMTDNDSEKGTNNSYPFIMNAVTGEHGSIYQPSLFTILTAYLGDDVNDWIVFAENLKERYISFTIPSLRVRRNTLMMRVVGVTIITFSSFPMI